MMNTIILSNTEEDIKKAAQLIKNGELVGMPTETVYGLAADALNGTAVANIFKAKGRPMDNPLIVHIASIDDITRFNLVSDFPKQAQILAEKFWPGPLTIIMPKSAVIPNEVSAGLETVAIRFPSHKTAQKLIEFAQTPIAAPSANLSGSPSPTTAQHVYNDMQGKIPAIIDGGECSVGVESTVISLAENPPRLLRPGGITLEQMQAVIGEITVDNAVLHKLEDNQKAASPGMKYKHYAPKANVTLLQGNAKQYAQFVNEHSNANVAALCYDEDIKNLNVITISMGKENDLDSQAHMLFDALRKIDEFKNITTVYARCPKPQGVGMAVYNRLIRAAGFEVKNLEEL